ncbi:putative nuclease HARBI1 [Cucumis melo var. makuwa]|uniref:Nuclease HARBI1 n=1 Tax=Cucumis melo var. makuwa TaxID=1194695 RepID=A0A5A7V1R3_CUCMM|nr:putative nuclease HARBI1 [Cucumis melo var. makuwa]TYK05830.1 putative nuclease HARBI1 [Cucumis melo var. makuwa]
MERRCYTILCTMLRTRGRLEATQYVNVEEMVAIFLHIVAHDVKNRIARRHFARLVKQCYDTSTLFSTQFLDSMKSFLSNLIQ